MTTSTARIVSMAGFALSLLCVALLHVVRTDLAPLPRRLSEYATGPYGWLMTLAFIALGCGLIAMGLILTASRGPAVVNSVLPATAFLAGAGTIAWGMFRTGGSGTGEMIHSRASALAVVAVVALSVAYSRVARSVHAPDPIGRALAFAVLGLALIGPLLHHTSWTGLSQRLLWILLLTWLLRAARQLPRRPAPPVLASENLPRSRRARCRSSQSYQVLPSPAPLSSVAKGKCSFHITEEERWSRSWLCSWHHPLHHRGNRAVVSGAYCTAPAPLGQALPRRDTEGASPGGPDCLESCRSQAANWP